MKITISYSYGNTMTVTDKNNCDMNVFFKQKRYRILQTRVKNTSTPSCHHEQQAWLLALTSPHASRPGEKRSSWQKKQASTQTTVRAIDAHVRYHTVIHISKYRKDRILTIGKYYDGYRQKESWHEWILQTKLIPNLAHTGDEHLETLRPPRAHEQQAQRLALTSPHASRPGQERASFKKRRQAATQTTVQQAIDTHVRYHTMIHTSKYEKHRILTIGKYYDGYQRK